MKPTSVILLAMGWALGMISGARAAEFIVTPEIQAQLEQIRAGEAQIRPAAPSTAARPKAPPVPDFPVNFQFNPEEVKGKDAVVLSVSGLNFDAIGVRGFQVSTVLWYYHRFFSGQKVDGQTASQIDRDAQDISVDAGEPEGIFDDALRAQLSGAGKKFLVVPMPWTHNPQKSAAAIVDFKIWLAQVSEAARRHGKPVYVIAHSWGTLLIYDALEELAKEGSPVRVDKFVTMGSPLAPSPWWVKRFVKTEEHYQRLEQQKIVKPANVKTWINFWAKRDQFSNSIAAADGGNFQVDAPADALASSILWKDPVFNKSAAKDWAELNSITSWHRAYTDGYHEFFPSIGRRIDIDVFGPEILPKL
jgi:hypothetical protein